MRKWRFMDYCMASGINLIQRWYDAQEKEVQAAFDATRYILAGTEDWLDSSVHEYRELKREHSGLGEVCFDIQVYLPHARKGYKRRFRIAGFLDVQTRTFIMFNACEKTRIEYKPTDAFDIAIKCKRQWEQGKGGLCERI